MSIILAFAYKHFFEAIVVFMFGIITKFLIKQFGKDRAQAIKDAMLTSMLWAEEVFGIGTGSEKWTKAWQKIIEILKKQGIKLTENEIDTVTIMMKSTIPEINAITYSALPEAIKTTRDLSFRNKETQKLINAIAAKHGVKK